MVNRMRPFKLVFIAMMCFVINRGQLNAQSEIKKPVTKKLVDSATIFPIKPQKELTHGTVTVEGKQINYKAIAGTIILKNNKDKPTCSMFYVAYFNSDIKNEDNRPLTFI